MVPTMARKRSPNTSPATVAMASPSVPAGLSPASVGPSSGVVAPAEASAAADFVYAVGSAGYRRSGDYITHDFIPTLNGQSAAQAFFEIGENDPLLGGILYTLEMLMRRVQWTVEPPAGKEDDEQAKHFAALVKRVLLHELDRPFADVIADAASMFQYGYAPLEMTFALAEEREDADGSDAAAPDRPTPGTLVLRALDLRAQTSITRWDIEPSSGKVRGLWQWDPARTDTREVYIPRAKLALFRTSPRSGSPEGRSLLRRAYTTWMRNQVMLEAEGRSAVRRAGFVVARVPNQIMRSDADEASKAKLRAIVRVVENVAADRQGAVVLPSDVDPDTKQPQYDIGYVTADGQQAADMSPIIERGDARMASSVLADFMLLGQTGATGSWALSKDKTTLFKEAFQGFVDTIAEEINRSALTRWWRLANYPAALRPVLKGGEVEAIDLAAIGSFLASCVSAQIITPDEPLEDHARTLGKLPKADKSTARALATPPETATETATETETAPNGTRAKAKAKAKANANAKGSGKGNANATPEDGA